MKCSVCSKLVIREVECFYCTAHFSFRFYQADYWLLFPQVLLRFVNNSTSAVPCQKIINIIFGRGQRYFSELVFWRKAMMQWLVKILLLFFSSCLIATGRKPLHLPMCIVPSNLSQAILCSKLPRAGVF